jgi:hypothetical protein
MNTLCPLDGEAMLGRSGTEIDSVGSVDRKRFAFVEIKDETVALGVNANGRMDVVEFPAKPVPEDSQTPECERQVVRYRCGDLLRLHWLRSFIAAC